MGCDAAIGVIAPCIIQRDIALLIATVMVLAPSSGAAQVPAPDVLSVTESTTLSADWYGSIRVQNADVVLNCAGHTVFGPGAEETLDHEKSESGVPGSENCI